MMPDMTYEQALERVYPQTGALDIPVSVPAHKCVLPSIVESSEAVLPHSSAYTCTCGSKYFVRYARPVSERFGHQSFAHEAWWEHEYVLYASFNMRTVSSWVLGAALTLAALLLLGVSVWYMLLTPVAALLFEAIRQYTYPRTKTVDMGNHKDFRRTSRLCNVLSAGPLE